MNSVGYLFFGGITGFGDIGTFQRLTGIPTILFALGGIPIFLCFFIIISFNVYNLFHSLLPMREDVLIALFWSILPGIFILVVFNPQTNIMLPFVIIGIGIMLIPSLMAFPLGRQLRKRNKDLGNRGF